LNEHSVEADRVMALVRFVDALEIAEQTEV
jgi:hypothetical protein